VQFTASHQTYEKLRRAQDLLRHSVPGGDLSEIIDRALTLLLKELKRAKLGAAERPRGTRAVTPKGRHIPPLSSVRCGNETADGVRSSGRSAGAPRRPFSNSIM
jgi:hypothetical protein